MPRSKNVSVESPSIEKLLAMQAEINAQIARLTAKKAVVTEEAVSKLTEQHFHTLRFALVVGGAEAPKKQRGKNAYELIKGADVKWYMALKGFENTLAAKAARKARGENVEVALYNEPNERTGRTQRQYAQEILTEMHNGGFIDATKGIFADSAKTSRKRR